MEKETRDVFFSLGGSSGSARVYDEKVAGRGEQGIEASRDDASAAVVESGRQSKTGIAAHGRNTGKQPLFSANFGTKQAWASAQEPAIRTQGGHDSETQTTALPFVYLFIPYMSPSLPKPVHHTEICCFCWIHQYRRTAAFTCENTLLKTKTSLSIMQGN